MKSIVSRPDPVSFTALTARHWPAWLLSVVALIVAGLPGYSLWAMFLFALAIIHWAWLVYGGRPRRTAGTDEDDRVLSQALRNLIVESSRTAGNDLRALRADLKQVRGLVHDAVVTLGDGFQGINERMRLEGEIIETLTVRMLGGTGDAGAEEQRAASVPIRALLQELQNIFQVHIDSLSAVAHCRDEAIHRMDELVTQIDVAVQSCRTGDRFVDADATGTDQLLDRLERARATALEMRHITAEVIVRDLTAALSTKRGVDAMLAESAELNSYLADVLGRASAATAGVNGSLGVLVRSLQFEDVVRQLLEYCDRQVAGIEIYIDGLVGLLADPKLGQQPEEQQARLMQACESYLENSTRWASDRQRHITQTSMQAGNVELF